MNNILIVDENARRASFFAASLAGRTQTASSAREAMALMRREAYAMILVSVSLPDMDGFELYEWLRLDPSSKTAGVWFVLDRADEQTKAACMRLGARGVLYGEPKQLTAMLRLAGLPLR